MFVNTVAACSYGQQVLCVQNSYQPTEVCKGLWIVPDWCEPPDSTALSIRMAPGLAFGTGRLSCN